MSYNAKKVISANESLLNQWDKDLQRVIDGDEEVAVVYKGAATGLSHHHYRKCDDMLKVGGFLTVKPAPQNKYDRNATGLFYGNKQVGWIPKALNRVCAKASTYCALEARIICHKEFKGDFLNILFVEVTATLMDSDDDNESSYDATDRAINEYYRDRNKSPPPWQKHPMASTTFGSMSEAQKKASADELTKPIKSQEQDTMATKVNEVIEKNITLGTNAAFLEAGRIANNQLSALAAKKLPMMARGYADTAFGRLLLANVAMAAAEHFRPCDVRLDRLTRAMATTAYQEVLQQFDIEQMIEDMLSNKTIAKALKAVDVEQLDKQ